MSTKKQTIDWPHDLIDEILDYDDTKGVIYDYPQIAKYFITNWDIVKKSLTPREERMLELRYEEGKTLEEIAKIYGITRERVRQIIAKGIRRLKHHSRTNILFKDNERITERDSLIKQIDNEILELRKKLKYYQKANLKLELPEEIQNEVSSNVRIEDLDLSVRSFRCLKRAGIEFVSEITEKTEEELLKIRNLGRKSVKEIKQKLKQMNLSLKSSGSIFDDLIDDEEEWYE